MDTLMMESWLSVWVLTTFIIMMLLGFKAVSITSVFAWESQQCLDIAVIMVELARGESKCFFFCNCYL